MDEGWTRLVLERFDFPYTTVHDADIRAGRPRATGSTILIPSIAAKVLREGYRPGETEPAYVGGLGAEGAAALREFVRGRRDARLPGRLLPVRDRGARPAGQGTS